MAHSAPRLPNSCESLFAIPAALAALAMTARHPVETECLLAWANAAVLWFWPD